MKFARKIQKFPHISLKNTIHITPGKGYNIRILHIKMHLESMTCIQFKWAHKTGKIYPTSLETLVAFSFCVAFVPSKQEFAKDLVWNFDSGSVQDPAYMLFYPPLLSPRAIQYVNMLEGLGIVKYLTRS